MAWKFGTKMMFDWSTSNETTQELAMLAVSDSPPYIPSFSYSSKEFEHDGYVRHYLFAQGTLPNVLVVIFHGYQGSAEAMLPKYEEVRKKGFSMLIPQGYEKSWNADSCCGEAITKKIKDIDFIEKLLDKVLEDYFNSASKDDLNMKIYLVGQSNGAFMVSKLALLLIAEKKKWINGVIMFSGYSYREDLYTDAKNEKVSLRFPVLQIHGLDDSVVSPEGCCGHIHCCCDITYRKCVSVQTTFENWLKINHCKTSQPETSLFFDYNGAFNCFQGIDCIADVKLCLFPGTGHSYDFVGKAAAEFLEVIEKPEHYG